MQLLAMTSLVNLQGIPDVNDMDTASVVSIDLNSSVSSNDAMDLGGGEKPPGDPPDSPD